MTRRSAAFRKSDFTPAFEAAKAAGYDEVCIVVEADDGKRFMVTASCKGAAKRLDMTPFEKWKASHVSS
ncbi:hypothetical protein [Pseudophaeobacter arcticus]|jgi:hypothetical protein|uniref:hypothetical protein n=1 Tax=Pseudophaeobacter arcticus TaxID=385492 RepID=UPI0039E32052